MLDKKIIKLGLFHALGVAAYISLVAFIMSNGSKWFGEQDGPLTPVAVLLLFVLSAAVTGGLTFGRSLMWYLDGLKKEAVQLAVAVVGWLFVLTVIAFILNVVD